MTHTIAIPILITLAAFLVAHLSLVSHTDGRAIEWFLNMIGASIVSLTAWLVWALVMWWQS